MRIQQGPNLFLSGLVVLSMALLLMSGCSNGQESSNSTSISGSDARPTRHVSQNGTTRSQRELRGVAIESLLALSSHLNPEIRANALEALQGHTRSLESVAALGLSDRNAGVRSVGAMVVGKQGLTDLVPMLELLLTDPSPFVRASAMYGLVRTGNHSGRVDLTPLSDMLLESGDIRVSSHAAYVLGEIGNRSAVPLLEQAGARAWGQIPPISRQIFRLQIAEALVKLGDEKSMDSVRSALYPSRPEELEATALAVQIIGEVGDRGSVDQLIYLVDEETDRPMPAEVRLAVAGALAKLGLLEGGFIADEFANDSNPAIRAQAGVVYGRTGRVEHLAKLEEMLTDDSAQVRVGCAGAILEILGR